MRKETATPAPAEPPGGRRLGHYRLLDAIGEGGMGVVYRAENAFTGQMVALKVMRPEVACDVEARGRFLREAQAAAGLDHPNVVRVHTAGEADGTPYIDMQLLRGESLRDRLDRDGPLPVPALLKVGAELADGLAAAHLKGLVHRDVKPANVFLADEPAAPGGWRAVLLDLGLARRADDRDRITATGISPGTPAYMSPEQKGGESPSPAHDIYSLGLLLYEAATGRRPVGPAEPPRQRNPAVPEAASALIVRMLAADAAARPASAREVAEAFRRLIEPGKDATEVTAAPAPPPRRRRWPWIALAGIVVAAVGIDYAMTRSPSRTGPDPATPKPAVVEPLTVDLAVTVWKREDTTKGLRIDDPKALPLRAKDYVRLEVRLNRPAYVYVVHSKRAATRPRCTRGGSTTGRIAARRNVGTGSTCRKTRSRTPPRSTRGRRGSRRSSCLRGTNR